MRVLFPFLVWCVIYAFYQFMRGNADLSATLINILHIPVNYGTQVGHLWYVYMLLGIYLFAPIISHWLQTAPKSQIQFYLIIWAITMTIPYIHLLFSEIWGECFWNKTPMLYYFSGFLGFAVLRVLHQTISRAKRQRRLFAGVPADSDRIHDHSIFVCLQTKHQCHIVKHYIALL